MNYTTLGTKWTSNTKYVDIETGEQLKISQIHETKEYIIIKTTKYAKTNYNKTKGHIEYTRECRRNQQGKLFTDSERTNT